MPLFCDGGHKFPYDRFRSPIIDLLLPDGALFVCPYCGAKQIKVTEPEITVEIEV